MYDSDLLPLAERQRAATRDAILDAAFHLLHDEPPALFSHETVAARARVAARTVYRHFPARTDLTLALWQRIRDSAGIRWPASEAEILPALRLTFAQFDEHAQITRAVIASAAQIGYAVHGSAEGRDAFRRSLATILHALPPEEGDRLVGACLAIYSAPFWQMLRDRGELSAKESQDAGVFAMDAVLTAARIRATVNPTF